ncbi:MAG: HAD-IB family hydrolase [Legionellales bacterium]|nr:HAD-IB family hydrolase [Legionellales bacterium]|tara:strand:+ start:105 stop:809 length:705 start_codon:yes stop_codon:yes gene_type:complete
MRLAIFDLDETLIAKDSDHLWGEFLVEEGLVDPQVFLKSRQALSEAYVRGDMVFQTYINHSLNPILHLTPTEQEALAKRFTELKLIDHIYPEAMTLIEHHKKMGDTCLVITAALTFLSRHISYHFPIDFHIGSDVHLCPKGGLTLEAKGVPSFQEGKVQRLLEWLDDKDHSLAGSHFYSDSSNDIPLLEFVEHPIVVNPDARLKERALAKGWPILTLKHPSHEPDERHPVTAAD